MSDDPIPEMIRAAGADAVRAYRSYFDATDWSRPTRRRYASEARRSFDWAARRGLALETIDAPAFATYRSEAANNQCDIHSRGLSEATSELQFHRTGLADAEKIRDSLRAAIDAFLAGPSPKTGAAAGAAGTAIDGKRPTREASDAR